MIFTYFNTLSVDTLSVEFIYFYYSFLQDFLYMGFSYFDTLNVRVC